MSYEVKFQTLIRLWREVLQTIQIDEHDEERKRTLLADIEHCEREVNEKTTLPRQAFFSLLRHAAILIPYDLSNENGKDEQAILVFRQALKDAISDVDVTGNLLAPAEFAPRSVLLERQEYLFVFLFENARLLLPGSTLGQLTTFANTVLHPTPSFRPTLPVAIWEMAVLLFRQLDVASKVNHRHLSDVLFGFLTNKTNHAEIRQERERIEKQIAPLKVQDYIFYRMTSKIAAPKLLDDGFLDTVLRLMRKQDAKPIYPRLIKEVNTLYQSLSDEVEQEKLKKFVEQLNQFDELVQDLQEKTDKLEKEFNLMNTSEKFAFISPLKQEVAAKRLAIEQFASSLKQTAKQLFAQGKPASKWRLIVGMGLMIIGAGLLLAGIAALVSCPLALAAAGSVAAALQLGATGATGVGIASIVFGSISLLGSGLCFFKGRSIPPSSVSITSNRLIATCEKAGIRACETIEKTNMLGIDFSPK
jgi:hypothetical protein